MTIKRIGPVSCAKVAGLIYSALGLLVGIFIALFSVLGAMFSPAGQQFTGKAPFPMSGAFLGVGAIIFMPIFYGIIGAIFAMIGAWIYNLVASVVGGIEIDAA